MAADANPTAPGDDAADPDDPDDAAALARHAAALADAIEASLPRWVERSVAERLLAHRGAVTDGERRAGADAGRAAVADVGARVRALLDEDVDRQRSSPLAALRQAVAYPTAVLRASGVPPVRRDEFARHQFPDDDYDLTPATFADVDPSLSEPGLTWGAAKAHVHLARRRREGRR